jgi:hypothetical protein
MWRRHENRVQKFHDSSERCTIAAFLEPAGILNAPSSDSVLGDGRFARAVSKGPPQPVRSSLPAEGSGPIRDLRPALSVPLSSVVQLGIAAGPATIGTAFFSRLAADGAFVDAMQTSLLIGLALFAAALLACFLLPRPAPPAPAPVHTDIPAASSDRR